MKFLVTGAAGFIGYHVAARLLAEGHGVVGLDNLNDYYDPSLKEARLDQLRPEAGFEFVRGDVADRDLVHGCIGEGGFDRVIHLAAQAGVRYSIDHPEAYVQANLVGFGHVLEACRHAKLPHLVFASSSSVYGANARQPFSEHRGADHPMSMYAATKRANELMAHSYASLFGLPATGLRFFTVYGPWGRPDMALFLFTRAILAGEPIRVFNHGKHLRDFTYIDDIVEGVVKVAYGIASPNPDFDRWAPDPASAAAPFRVYNIGNSRPVPLLEFIEAIEQALGKEAVRENLPLQPGDVPDTWADCTDLEHDFGYRPQTPVRQGIERFVAWYRDYYGE